MSFGTKEEWLSRVFPGVGVDRIAERTQGCWNCIHWDCEGAEKRYWDQARNEWLQKATGIAINSPAGENHPVVRNLREMIPKMDASFTTHQWGLCSRGRKPDGSETSGFIERTYMCDRWTAKIGASVARAGQAADKLPEEVMERTFGPQTPDGADVRPSDTRPGH